MNALLFARKTTGLFALTLLYASTLVHAGDAPRDGNQIEFGVTEDRFVAGGLEPTPAGPVSLRERLLRQGILDEADFAAISPRQPLKIRARQPQVEELPAPPKTVAPQDSGMTNTPATESDRKPPRQPTLAEKIRYRYSDPRELRLLNQLTPQSAVTLYIEVAQMIDTRHLKPSTYAQRVDAAFEHLDLALNTASFQQAVRLRADDQSVGRLKDSLSKLRDRVKIKNLDDAVATLNRVQDLVERNVSMSPGAVGLEFVHAELDTLDQYSSLIPAEKVGGPSVGLKDNVVGIGVEVEPHAEGLKGSGRCSRS